MTLIRLHWCCAEVEVVEGLLAEQKRAATAAAEASAKHVAEIAAAKAVAECAVCLDAVKAVRLDPCGHALCGQCSGGVQACPVCRTAITARQTLFLS